MYLQGLGTTAWRLEGRVMFTTPRKLRNARERIRGILLKCHKQLGFSEAENKKFSEYLGQTANLNVKKDTQPFAEEGHHWNVEPNAQGMLFHFLLNAYIASHITRTVG